MNRETDKQTDLDSWKEWKWKDEQMIDRQTDILKKNENFQILSPFIKSIKNFTWQSVQEICNKLEEKLMLKAAFKSCR